MCTNTIPSPFFRWLVRGMSVLLLITLTIALLPTGVSAAPLAKLDCDRTYEVKRGDTLGEIASAYNRAANQFVAANDWNKPYTIYVGQRICIPTKNEKGAPKLDRKYTTAEAVYFGAGRSVDDGNLLVYTYNYPKTTVIVKVDNADDSEIDFVKVGRINIATVGNQRTWRFKLPEDLKDARKIFICLKDTTTNYSQCVYPRTGP